VVNATIFENTWVLDDVPSSIREKFVTGDGEPVKENDVDPLGVASLTMVIEPGKMTASAESERSWLPPEPSNSIKRM
jgi:hypothetical protein